jgi:hypothetical protein
MTNARLPEVPTIYLSFQLPVSNDWPIRLTLEYGNSSIYHGPAKERLGGS